MPRDLLETIYTDLRKRQQREKTRSKRNFNLTDRAEYTDSTVAMPFADLPVEGLGDSIHFVTFLFVTDGRKPGETGGNGTGVFAYWDDVAGVWKNMHDYAQVQI